MPASPAHTQRQIRLRKTATAVLTATGIAALALTAAPASAGAAEPAVRAANARAVSWDVKAADVTAQRLTENATTGAEEADEGTVEAGAREHRHHCRHHGAESGRQDEDTQDTEGTEDTDETEGTADAQPEEAEEEQAQAAAPESAPAEEAAPESAPAGSAPEPAAEPQAQPSSEPAAEEAAPAPAAQTESAPAEAAEPEYPDNLDGWIRESLAVMADHGIPGSYNGLYRNIIRESSGNPWAINNWDINAINGTPSKGLLQVIQPTFDTYHVEGTSWDIYDPVANITAAANYAWHRYGSIDNVNGPY
ncbi:transglycosylase SLT domain-containing protein [Streptomyces hoynatensis]|uniref:Lytic transglycosylase n=1 Tax=Streptomyces hoynatensis TaxID=1141874 RepID=A0A3A9Z1J7_9ACTN|nr:transglycosylase SLT domain-containing protein [Streptomyces hoynatensis]RKN42281.1 lytic transglycosylase [Streptomyces hoynatensis]